MRLNLPTLPQNTIDADSRQARLSAARSQYRFDHTYHDLGFARSIPPGEDYTPAYKLLRGRLLAQVAANQGASRLSSLRAYGNHTPRAFARWVLDQLRAKELAALYPRDGHHLAPYDQRSPLASSDYRRMFRRLPVPSLMAAWDKRSARLGCDRGDEAARPQLLHWETRLFARLRLAGPNACMLRRVQDADRARDPASLWDRLGWSKAPGPARIEAAARTGTLFVADYHAMTGMAPGVTKDYLHFGWAPIALFIVEGASNEGDLAPVLIQCGQDPSRFPHFTPEDGIAWKMAMTAVNVADNSYQGMVLHFTRCHLIMEAITLACHRNLSAEHPLMILLQPHFEMTLRANVDMRAMVGPGGVLPTIQSLSHDACVRLARAEIATFRWDEQQLDAEIARRDVDADALEFYPWRDDLRSARGPIASFVEQYVHLYYSGDTEVAGDVELANLLRELGAHDGGRINGLPLVKSKRSLGSFLTGVIFRATAYHATINYSGYDNWGCVPLSPTSGYYPEPYEAKEAIEENLWRMFAPPEVASQLLGVGWILRETRVNQLGSYRPGHFLDTRAGQLVHRFQRDLHDVDEQLKEIDARREISYPWAQPSRVPASIHV